jgi:hypothetical protein
MANLNPAGGLDVCLLWVLCVVMCLSLVQKSPTKCGVIEEPNKGSLGPQGLVNHEKKNVPHKCQMQTFINVHEVIITHVLLTRICLMVGGLPVKVFTDSKTFLKHNSNTSQRDNTRRIRHAHLVTCHFIIRIRYVNIVLAYRICDVITHMRKQTLWYVGITITTRDWPLLVAVLWVM